MAERIYKYEFKLTEHLSIMMPVGAKVIKFAPHGGELCCWAIVDEDVQAECTQHFELRGTGHDLGDVGSHVATIFTGIQQRGPNEGAPFVWHIFNRRTENYSG